MAAAVLILDSERLELLQESPSAPATLSSLDADEGAARLQVRELARRAALDGEVAVSARTTAGGWLAIRATPTDEGEVAVVIEPVLPGTPEYRDAVTRAAGLTPREREVVDLAFLGLDAREIARRLSTSLATTKVHLGRIYRKLGVGGQTESISLLTGVTSAGPKRLARESESG